MDIIVVNGREAIGCPHCAGTGICHMSVLKTSDKEIWAECSNCGTGVVGTRNFWWGDTPYTAPTCRVCGGKGYNFM